MALEPCRAPHAAVPRTPPAPLEVKDARHDDADDADDLTCSRFSPSLARSPLLLSPVAELHRRHGVELDAIAPVLPASIEACRELRLELLYLLADGGVLGGLLLDESSRSPSSRPPASPSIPASPSFPAHTDPSPRFLVSTASNFAFPRSPSPSVAIESTPVASGVTIAVSPAWPRLGPT